MHFSLLKRQKYYI